MRKGSTYDDHLVPADLDRLVPAHGPGVAAVVVVGVEDLDVVDAVAAHLGLGLAGLVDPVLVLEHVAGAQERHVRIQAVNDLRPRDLRVDDRVLALGRAERRQGGEARDGLGEHCGMVEEVVSIRGRIRMTCEEGYSLSRRDKITVASEGGMLCANCCRSLHPE